MKVWEVITEATNSIQDDVAKALPMTFTIPKLQNSDAYKQYRFGVALANSRSKKAKDQEKLPAFQSSSPWGENQVVVSYSNSVDDVIDDALKDVGLTPNDKKLITTPKSEEPNHTNKLSPVAKIQKNKYGV